MEKNEEVQDDVRLYMDADGNLEELEDVIEDLTDEEMEETEGGGTNTYTYRNTKTCYSNSITLPLRGTHYCSSNVTPSGYVNVLVGSGKMTISKKKAVSSVYGHILMSNGKGTYYKNYFVINFK